MMIRRRRTRIAIEQKTVRLTGGFTPGAATSRAAGAQVFEVASLQSAATPEKLPDRPMLKRLRSLYQAVRRMAGGRAGPQPADSATSGIALVPKPSLPQSKEPRS